MDRPARSFRPAVLHRRRWTSMARAESAKASKWAKLARKGHDIAWEFEKPGGGYTGRILIDGEIYTPREATKTFLKVQEHAQER